MCFILRRTYNNESIVSTILTIKSEQNIAQNLGCSITSDCAAILISPFVNKMNDNPEISGLLYKKRGGFGKMMPNAWQYRFFTVSKDGVFMYFDTESPEMGVFEEKARGRIDLRATNFELIKDQPVDGAPYPFVFLVAPAAEEKWKLCAERREDYDRWCKVLQRYAAEKAIFSKSLSMGSMSSDDMKHLHSVAAGDTTSTSISSPAPPLHTRGSSTPILHFQTHHHNQNQPQQNNTTKSAARAGKKVGKKGFKTSGRNTAMISQEMIEWLMVLYILNLCFINSTLDLYNFENAGYILLSNFVVGYSMYLRGQRSILATQKIQQLEEKVEAAAAKAQAAEEARLAAVTTGGTSNYTSAPESAASSPRVVTSAFAADSSGDGVVVSPTNSKPSPGFSFEKVDANSGKNAAEHTWCTADPRLFNVRIGPDYKKHGKKAPSGPALYEPFAVDVYCSKLRTDHAAQRFNLPDTSHLSTNHPHVPPMLIIQLQLPSEPPASLFSSAEDGPGWSIVMYYRITEETCRQLKDLSTASAAVKLFAQWCERAPVDPTWRARFKVICSCTNLAELGMPSAVTSWNAKPVLIRRTGTIFKGPNYLEMDIHIHKFANLAKQSIFLISSRCGLMFMQIGFVVEGRENDELPETLFACVAVNKPQEDRAEFIFDEDE